MWCFGNSPMSRYIRLRHTFSQLMGKWGPRNRTSIFHGRRLTFPTVQSAEVSWNFEIATIYIKGIYELSLYHLMNFLDRILNLRTYTILTMHRKANWNRFYIPPGDFQEREVGSNKQPPRYLNDYPNAQGHPGKLRRNIWWARWSDPN